MSVDSDVFLIMYIFTQNVYLGLFHDLIVRFARIISHEPVNLRSM